MTHVHTCIALGIATLGTLVMPGQAEDAPRLTLSGHIDQKQTGVHGMAEHDVVDIDVPTSLDPTTSVVVMIEGAPRKLELFQYSLRSLDFDLIVHEGDRMFTVDPPEVHTYPTTEDLLHDHVLCHVFDARSPLRPRSSATCA